MALTDKLSTIADAIRGKTGKTDTMTLDQMPTEIAGIQAGGGGIELLYESEFTLEEKLGSTTLTFQTGLTSAEVTINDVLLCVIMCTNDTDTDTSYTHYSASTQPLFVSANGAVPINAQLVHTLAGSKHTINAAAPFTCKWVGAYAASLQISGTGSYAGFGIPPAGDYSLRLYRVSAEMIGLEGM